MRRGLCLNLVGLVLLSGALSGCRSPYHADRGAALGAGTGAVLGAIVGNAAGKNPLAGAAIGGVAGAITGNAIGQGMDEVEARNRAQIEAQMGRQIQAGAVTIPDVVTMTQAGVQEDLIITHIQTNHPAHPLSAADLIHLQQQGVPPRVVQAMQAPPPPPRVAPVGYQAGPPPVIVHEPAPVIVERHYWRRPHCHPPRRHSHFGVTFHN